MSAAADARVTRDLHPPAHVPRLGGGVLVATLGVDAVFAPAR
jgi:hypothetical protein